MDHTSSSAMPLASERGQTLHVILTTHACGGHEIMLLEWLAYAANVLGTPITLHMKPIKELLEKSQSKRLTVERLPSLPPKKYPILNLLADLKQTREVLSTIPRTDPVLFAPGIVQASPWHMWLAARMGYQTIAYVPMAHPSSVMSLRLPSLRDSLVKLAIRKVAHWITITEQQKSMLRDVWGIHGPIHVIPNLLSQGNAPRVEAPASPPGKRLRVLFLGRFDRNQKGLDWLVQVLREHAHTLQAHFEFAFQGQGPYQSELERLAMEHPGFIAVWPWGTAAQAFAKTDVLLLSSRFEGFPLVAIEAALYGVPVIASDRCGLSDVLPASSVFPFGDTAAWLTCLQDMQKAENRSANTTHVRAQMATLLSKDTFDQGIRETLQAIRLKADLNRLEN